MDAMFVFGHVNLTHSLPWIKPTITQMQMNPPQPSIITQPPALLPPPPPRAQEHGQTLGARKAAKRVAEHAAIGLPDAAGLRESFKAFNVAVLVQKILFQCFAVQDFQAPPATPDPSLAWLMPAGVLDNVQTLARRNRNKLVTCAVWHAQANTVRFVVAKMASVGKVMLGKKWRKSALREAIETRLQECVAGVHPSVGGGRYRVQPVLVPTYDGKESGVVKWHINWDAKHVPFITMANQTSFPLAARQVLQPQRPPSPPDSDSGLSDSDSDIDADAAQAPSPPRTLDNNGERGEQLQHGRQPTTFVPAIVPPPTLQSARLAAPAPTFADVQQLPAPAATAAAGSIRPPLARPQVLPRPTTAKKEWYHPTVSFNQTLAILTILFACSADSNGHGSRVVIPTTIGSPNFDDFGARLVAFAFEHLDLPIPYMLVHATGVDFSNERLVDVLFTLFGRKDDKQRKQLVALIGEYVERVVVRSEQVEMKVANLVVAPALVEDPAGSGVWVLNWAVEKALYAQVTSAIPMPAEMRPKAQTPKKSRSSRLVEPPVGPLLLAELPPRAAKRPLPQETLDSFEYESDEARHHKRRRGGSSVRKGSKASSASSSDPALDSSLFSAAAHLSPRRQRPSTRPMAPAASSAAAAASSSSGAGASATTMTMSSSTAVGSASAGAASTSLAAASSSNASAQASTSTSLPAPPLTDPTHARRLAQISVTRLQLLTAHPSWATNTWFRELQGYVRALGEELTPATLQAYGQVTAGRMQPGQGEREAVAMMPAVVGYVMVRDRFARVSFEYVSALFETASECGMSITREGLVACAEMAMEE
ncbi:hypothetical protein BCR44DRAFT_85998, partial [Catenaria anguillulae PL171]